MRVWLTLLLLLTVSAAAGVGLDVEADSVEWCAQTIGEVKLGMGPPVESPVPLLAGLAYTDVAFPACTGGGFWLDESSGNVQAHRICSQEVVRVYAVAGEAGEDFILNWKYAGTDDC